MLGWATEHTKRSKKLCAHAMTHECTVTPPLSKMKSDRKKAKYGEHKKKNATKISALCDLNLPTAPPKTHGRAGPLDIFVHMQNANIQCIANIPKIEFSKIEFSKIRDLKRTVVRTSRQPAILHTVVGQWVCYSDKECYQGLFYHMSQCCAAAAPGNTTSPNRY